MVIALGLQLKRDEVQSMLTCGKVYKLPDVCHALVPQALWSGRSCYQTNSQHVVSQVHT